MILIYNDDSHHNNSNISIIIFRNYHHHHRRCRHYHHHHHYYHQYNKYINKYFYIDLVQLHGSEPPEYIDQIIVPCIKVIHIPSTDDNNNDNDDDNNNDVHSLKAQAQLFSNRAIAILLGKLMSRNKNNHGCKLISS
jgi:hypothetical protein